MSVERTLSIIKPDAVSAGHAGAILALIEAAGFKILALRMTRLTETQARGFYGVHKGKHFYQGLVEFMTQGPIIVMALERKNAIAKLREVMGPTDPKKADEGTIRRRFATDVKHNAIHGSDSPATAKTELQFFFNNEELL